MDEDLQLPDIPPDNISPQQVYMLLLAMHTQQTMLFRSQRDQGAQMASLRADQKDMLEAWRAAGNLMRFIKLIAGVATAIGVLWMFFDGFLKMLKGV